MNMTRLLRAHRTLRLAKPSRRLLSAACLVGLFCFAPPAAAQDVFFTDFAPLGEGVTDTVAGRINEHAKEQLGGPARVEFTDEVSAEQAATGNAAIAQADAAYDRGISLYILNDYAAAIEAFDEALRLYDANPGDIQRFDPVMDTTFKLAECHFKAGNEERARTVLSRALALRPEQAANESSGQAYNQFYGSIQSNFARSGSGTLEVDSSPSGLPLQINGVDVGTTPFSGTMPAGTHYLRVANDDGVGTGRAVELARGRTEDVNLDFAQAMAAMGANAGPEPRFVRSLRSEVARGTISDALIPYMRELSTRLGVSYVVVGVIVAEEGGYKAMPFLYRASDDLFANVPTQRFDAEMSNISVNAYQLAASIARALRSFPDDDLVTGAPILVAAPTQAAPSAPSASGMTEPTLFVIDLPSEEPTPSAGGSTAAGVGARELNGRPNLKRSFTDSTQDEQDFGYFF